MSSEPSMSGPAPSAGASNDRDGREAADDADHDTNASDANANDEAPARYEKERDGKIRSK